MSTTVVAPSSADKTAVGKPAMAKPNGPSGSAGQFAALMQLQADEQAQSSVLTNTTPSPSPSPTDSHTSAQDDTDANVNSPLTPEALPQALQALLDWRGMAKVSDAKPGSATTAPTTLSATAGGSRWFEQPLTPTPSVPAATAQASEWMKETQPRLDNEGGLQLNAADWSRVSSTSNEQNEQIPTANLPDAQRSDAPRAVPSAVTANVGLSEFGASATQINPRATGSKSATSASVRGQATGMATEAGKNTTLLGNAVDAKNPVRATVDLASHTEQPATSPPSSVVEGPDTPEPEHVAGPPTTDTTAAQGIQPAEMPVAQTAPEATPAEGFADVFQGQMEEAVTHMSYWVAQGAKRASFTIGSALDAPVNVELSFVSGELQVAFESDTEGVRELLRDNAQEALQRLMADQGIALGGVSVGSGRAQTAQDEAPGQPTLERARRGRGTQTATTSQPSVGVRPPQIMTATKLDFYA